MKVSRPVETGVRREYATDQKWLHTTPKTIVERIRFDRLQKGWSAATLAQKAGLAPRKIKYHEERNTKDEALPLTYAKACGKRAVGRGRTLFDRLSAVGGARGKACVGGLYAPP